MLGWRNKKFPPLETTVHTPVMSWANKSDLRPMLANTNPSWWKYYISFILFFPSSKSIIFPHEKVN
jgi:hypothetical protein